MPIETIPQIKLGQNGSKSLNPKQIDKINEELAKCAVVGEDATFADVTADSVQLTGGFDTQGTMTWNNDEETVDIVQNGAVLQVGQELQLHVRNNTETDIPDGTVVYITGALGASGKVTIAPYIADGSIPINLLLGMTTEVVPKSDDGKVTDYGKVRGVDTSMWSDGDELYPSSTVAGGLTSTRPVYPNFASSIATVVDSHATNGTLFIRTQVDDQNESVPVDGSRDAVAFQCGDGTNEIAIDGDGILRGRGTGMGWDDLRVAISATSRGALRAPDFVKFLDNGAGSTGVYLYHFDKSTEEEVHFEVQLPHDWKEGTDIHAHVHWCPITAGGVGEKAAWGLEYAWKNITGTYGNTSFVYGNTTVHNGDLEAKRHYITELTSDGTDTGDQIIGTGLTLSSMLVCRFFRDATSALSTDDYDDDAAVLEIDFHYQRDSFGSDQEYSKTP